MPIPSIPPSAPVAASNINYQSLRNQGFSLIATNPWMGSTGAGPNTTAGDNTLKIAHVATTNASELVAIYGNFWSIQGNQSTQSNYNHIMVGAAFQKAGPSGVTDDAGEIVQMSFKNGKNKIHIAPSSLAQTEPSFFNVAKNEVFFTRNYVSVAAPTAPSAPTLTPLASGGALLSGAVYYVSIMYVFPDGMTSKTSAATSATIPGTATQTGIITVTSPASIAGAIGYRCVMTTRNGATGGLYTRVDSVNDFGINSAIKNEVTSNTSEYYRSAGARFVPQGNGAAGGTNYNGLNTGEGYSSGDQTNIDKTTDALTQFPSSNVYMPLAIIGRTLTPQKTVALIGDSIQAGTGDGGYVYASGGHATRALCNQMAMCFNPATAPSYAHVRVPLGGEQYAQFADQLNTNQYNRSRIYVTTLATNVISNYGTNDFSNGLASMKASALTVAGWYIARGIKFIQLTLLPRTTSTDGWQTASSQTVLGTESVRTGFNAWLRDTTSTGFVSQAGGSLCAVIDICAGIEVNSSNSFTLNGGFWAMPTGISTITGTFTGTPNVTQMTDTTKSLTANQYKGWNLVITSGAAINQQNCISYNSNNLYNLQGDLTTSPTVGDSYKITQLATVDGTHPASWGHVQAALTIQSALPSILI